MSTPARIVVVGDVVTDVMAVLAAPLAPGSDTPADIQMTGGGQGANTAAWLAAEQTPVTLIAAVGDDVAGRARVAELNQLGVDCAVRRQPKTPTGTVVVLTTAGERTMITERGANMRLTSDDVVSALSATPDARHLHLSGYTLLDPGSREAGLHALAAARGRGLTTSVDASSAAPLRRVGAAAFLDWINPVDLLLANADEAAVLAGERELPAQARRLTRVARTVVVKRGAAGAVWVPRSGAIREVPAPQVDMVDPTGAGDAFAAGLLAAWVGGATAEAAMARAVLRGASAVRQVGARPVERGSYDIQKG